MLLTVSSTVAHRPPASPLHVDAVLEFTQPTLMPSTDARKLLLANGCLMPNTASCSHVGSVQRKGDRMCV